jgi:hypothetical protein
MAHQDDRVVGGDIGTDNVVHVTGLKAGTKSTSAPVVPRLGHMGGELINSAPGFGDHACGRST